MKKIVIADDEHKIIMTLEYAFKKAGYEVFIARDGSEVLELLKTEIPDMILLDIMMPNIDGYTTLAEIKKEKRDFNSVEFELELKEIFEKNNDELWFVSPWIKYHAIKYRINYFEKQLQ